MWTFENGKITGESGIMGKREVGTYSWDDEGYWMIKNQQGALLNRMKVSMFGATFYSRDDSHYAASYFYPKKWLHEIRSWVGYRLHIRLQSPSDHGYL